ncbi:MAG: protein-tyrosine phosphatase [Crocinitomix sp.]|jgi:protein-tyrosine phosphatase
MNFFKKLFNAGPKLPPLDLSILGTDLHSHLIPAIDDGSKSLEDSIAMLKKFAALGYKKIITTPHVMSDFYRNSPETILSGLDTVKKELSKQGIDIEIEAAAEYYLDFHLNELIKEKKVLTFGDRYVLFELSFSQEQPNVNETIFELITEGYKPILAHVERYPFYNNNWERIQEFRDRGVLLQLNMLSLTGHYGPQVKRMAELLVERDWIDVIGSDCHHFHHLEMIDAMRTNPFLHKLAAKENLLNKSL